VGNSAVGFMREIAGRRSEILCKFRFGVDDLKLRENVVVRALTKRGDDY